jgi:hypothetical protein
MGFSLSGWFMGIISEESAACCVLRKSLILRGLYEMTLLRLITRQSPGFTSAVSFIANIVGADV